MSAMRNTVLLLLASAACVPFSIARSQTGAPMPEIDQIRAWMQEHHPALISGDSGINAAVIVVDTNAKYVRSLAFTLIGTAMTSGGVETAAAMHDDSAWTSRLDACVRDRPEPQPNNPPLCILDGKHVKDIDHLRFFASSAVVVLKPDEAATRYGGDAKNGAVVVTTDAAALARYARLGVTADNFLSFVTRRIRRRADGASVTITVLMVRLEIPAK